ncbi:claudin-19 [Cyprinodon tularosa]|uniref:Claudin n=1 Tax=Cyprinodon variegatus TaxID=28743 RepID=A0A3Q2DEM8_CYPVA|nr:PREDICTED: claudin-19-like [Cyprinodon variegatus]XP_038128084.1 claudin-19 [Cyprinodon tularosa]
MASFGLQVAGFLISLVGVSATIAATFMVEWGKQTQGKNPVYDGLWMSCSGTAEKSNCELYKHILKVPTHIQATRSVMLVSLFLSAMALISSVLGMKCTRFMEAVPQSKVKATIVGGILFIISGLLTIIITSWYISVAVETTHSLINKEFGHAVFVSLAGGFLTALGGVILSLRRCGGSRGSAESISTNQLLTTKNIKDNYV